MQKKSNKNKKLKIKNIIIIFILAIVVYIAFIFKEGYDMYSTAISEISIESRLNKLKSIPHYTPIDKIPKDFKNAIIAIEDNRFFTHGAIDFKSIARATVTNIKTKSLAEGGSTITQQLAKNMYFSRKKEFSRKIAEVFVAHDLEKDFTKSQILEAYINIIYYGDGYTGIGQASIGYFKKEPLELTLNEQTLLAGLPNAPSMLALSSNSSLAKERQDMVLDAMSRYNYISAEQINSIKNKE